MARGASGAPPDPADSLAWSCILGRCGEAARRELLKDASEGRWVKNAFVVDGLEEMVGKPFPQVIDRRTQRLRLDPELRGPDILIRIWVTMSRSPSRVAAFRQGSVIPFLKTFRGSGLAHPQYAEIARRAVEKNLAADHALIEFRRPASDGRPGKSWSIGFAGDKGRVLSSDGASVRSYDWWFNDKLWKSLERINQKKTPPEEEIPAVLIGMGKMTADHVQKLETLLRDTETAVLQEYKSPQDYRLYLKYPPGSALAKFSMLIYNRLGSESPNVLNCIGFALNMFPDVIQCPNGLLEPGRCSGKIPPVMDQQWCPMSESCLPSPEGPPAKRRKL